MRFPGSEVLIYYCCETAPEGEAARNYDVICGWLTAGGIPEARVIAERLLADRTRFASAVDEEIEALRNSPMPTLLLTNRLARRNLAWTSMKGHVPFSCPIHSNYILSDSPLAQATCLRELLRVAAAEFSPEAYSFILVVKSHGTPTRAITPRLALRHEEWTAQEFVPFAVSGRVGRRRRTAAGRPGVSRCEVVHTLRVSGTANRMQFPIVFFESCGFVADCDTLSSVPSTVGNIYACAGRNARYRNINYASVFAGKEDLLLSNELDCILKRAFTRVEKNN